jgi:hypothetical protein
MLVLTYFWAIILLEMKEWDVELPAPSRLTARNMKWFLQSVIFGGGDELTDAYLYGAFSW